MPVGALAGVAAGIAIVSIGFYHALFVAPRLRALARLLADADASDATADSVARVRSSQATYAKMTDQRLAELERVARRDVHRVGFVRYNSFSDVGSDLSFTLALLNAEGDGVLVTTIYSREETRTYGKAVRSFAPQQDASEEEQAALALAREDRSSRSDT